MIRRSQQGDQDRLVDLVLEIERETATIAKRFEQPDDKLKQGRNLDVVKVAIAMLGKWGMISAPRYNKAVEDLAQWEQLNKEGYEPYRVRLAILGAFDKVTDASLAGIVRRKRCRVGQNRLYHAQRHNLLPVGQLHRLLRQQAKVFQHGKHVDVIAL